MTHPAFRDFLARAESNGLLRRVAAEVDPAWEPGCLVKWMYQALPPEQRFGFLFEHVRGSALPLATAVLGASPVADAFFVAFRIPNMFRRLFAEGAFDSAFIPLFSKRLHADPEGARVFAGQALSGLAVLLIAVVLMVFYVYAMMCVSTNAIVIRETGGGLKGLKWAAFQFAWMTALAYGAALLVYRVGLLLGFAG